MKQSQGIFGSETSRAAESIPVLCVRSVLPQYIRLGACKQESAGRRRQGNFLAFSSSLTEHCRARIWARGIRH